MKKMLIVATVLIVLAGCQQKDRGYSGAVSYTGPSSTENRRENIEKFLSMMIEHNEKKVIAKHE